MNPNADQAILVVMRLTALQSTTGKYCLLEYDRMFGLALAAGLSTVSPPQPELSDLLKKSAHELFPHTTAVVLDSSYTYAQILEKPDAVGAVFSLEQRTEAVDPLALPRLADNWGVEYVRNNYGVAKLELYYHPAEELAYKKQQFVQEIADSCRYHGIDFILQLFVYHPLSEPPEQAVLLNTQLHSVHEFARSCDMLAIEYLGDPLMAATITADLDVPWVLTSRSTDYDTTKTDLRVALESGAQGFMVGEVFWPNLPVTQQNPEAAFAAVQTTSRDRLLELTRITNEFVQ